MCATKLVSSLRDKSFITSMNLPSLLYRHRRSDLIFLFKLLYGYFDLYHSSFSLFLTTFKPEVMHTNYLRPLPTIHVKLTTLINDWKPGTILQVILWRILH